MVRELSEDIHVYVVPMPPRIQSYVVRKDSVFTICISDALNDEAKMRAYKHEMFHIQNGDFDSDFSTALLEIRAHRSEK